MTEEPQGERNIADELARLGKQVAETIRAAWESEDRKKLQAEIADGLEKFGQEVTTAFDKASESDTARDLRVKAEKVAADINASGAAEEIRKGILTGLDAVNRELSKLLERLEPKTAEPVTPADEPPADPGI